MPQRSLPHRDRAAVRPLLPLPLVPARNRVGICYQRADRIEPRRGAVGTAGTRGHAVEQRPRADDRSLSATAGLRCGATTRLAGRHSASCESGRWTTPIYLPPDIHIFTSSKQPWVILPPDVPAAAEYHDRNAHWPPQSLERRRVLLAVLAANQNEAPALASGAPGDRPVAEPDGRNSMTNRAPTFWREI